MPRRAVVSRNIRCLNVKVLCVNIETEKTFTQDFILHGKNDKVSDRMLMKFIIAQCDATTKPVHIISKRIEIMHCSVPIEEYLSIAKKSINEKE